MALAGALAPALALTTGRAWSSAHSNCDTDALSAVVNGKRLALLSCAGVAYGGVRATVAPGETVRIAVASGGSVPRLSTVSPAVSIAGSEIKATRTGSAAVLEDGWPCASGGSSGRLLQIVVTR